MLMHGRLVVCTLCSLAAVIVIAIAASVPPMSCMGPAAASEESCKSDAHAALEASKVGGRLAELRDPATYSALVYTPSRNAVVANDDVLESSLTPLLLYLHGAGESGSNLRDLISEGATGTPPVALEQGVALPHLAKHFTMVAPQTARGWRREDISQFLDFLLSERSGLHLDPKRLYVTGHSMGGYGALVAGATRRFAAVVPVAPAGRLSAEDLAGVPVWAFHGRNDVVVPSRYSEMLISSMRQAGAPEDVARLTLYDEAPAPLGWPDYFGHASTIPAYGTPELYTWLLSKSL